MKTTLCIFLFAASIAHAETPHEVAKRVIAIGALMSPGVINDTAESQNNAAVLNSQIQLRTSMLGDTVSEELRVCYAISRIEFWLDYIDRNRGKAVTFNPTEKEYLRDRQILAAYFRQLNAAK